MENITKQDTMPFGKAEAEAAMALLGRYKSGKASLEERIKEENLWWRRRHFDSYKKDGTRVPAGAQLFNAVESKIADVYDNSPECSFLARSEDDEKTAALLTDIMPAVLEQNGMEKAFLAETREKITCGTGVYTVIWNDQKQGGVGDIEIRSVSPLNLYWEPGVSDIQESPALFFVDIVPNEVLLDKYKNLEGKLGKNGVMVTEYIFDDAVDSSKRTAVIDYYYKRGGKLHYAKICAGEVLYASENDEEYATRGWYDHGKYPFVFDVLFPLPGSPCGFGYVTVGKEQQYQIDRLSNAIVRNAIIASTRRKYVRRDANINEADLLDIEKDVVLVGGSRDVRESVMTIDEPTLSGTYVNVLSLLESTLKETTATRDFTQGGVSGGVTSGTAISALIEAGSKHTRAIVRASYNAYKEVVTLAFELMRQFYDTERVYRIKGEDGGISYRSFDNSMVAPKTVSVAGIDMGTKQPVFDIEIVPHKRSPFARVTQNTMMQEFYGMGFFNPDNAPQALSCLDGMEFEGKDSLCRKIEESGSVYKENEQLKQAIVRLASALDAEKGTNMAAQMAASFGINTGGAMGTGTASVQNSGVI